MRHTRRRRLRRLFWLGVLGGGGYAAYTARQRSRQEPGANGRSSAPSWPPIDTSDASGPAPFAGLRAEPAREPAPAPEAAPPPTWVMPVDGVCPSGHPIKANANSGIFHVPGGRFYDRTVPERCYANADDAIADGYRAAKA